jgi:putative MFS transporter
MDATAYSLGVFLDKLKLNRRHWTVFGVCSAGFVFDAMDFQIMALVAPSIAKEWSIDPQAMGFVLSATAVGMIIGSYLFGMLGDWMGRRFGFQVTIGIFALFSGLCAGAQNVTQLALLRLVTGIGIGGFVPIDTAMISEYMPASKRGRLLALWALFYPAGGLLAAWVARLVVPDLGWRALFLVGVAPAIMILLVRMLIPESPRFLLMRGRTKEAEASVQWIAMGQAVPPLTAPASTPSAARAQERMTLKALFNATYRRRTAMLWALWFSWSFSFFGVLLWLPSLLVQHRGMSGAAVFTYIMGFMLAGIAGRIAVSFIIDHAGRRYSIAGFGLCAAVMLILFGQQTTLENLILFGYIFAFFHDGGLSAVAPYTPELYPTSARSTGVGWAVGAGRLASVIAPIVVGFLVPIGLGAVFATLSLGFLVAALVVLLFGIETKGLILEEAALEAAPPASEPFIAGEKVKPA